jgi:Cation efflux family
MALLSITAAVHNVPETHRHTFSRAWTCVDLNAAWFATASIVSKEWLFRITCRVADQENSPVLLANAYHHRSDAYSVLVALVTILGSGWFPALPLDPIGGAYIFTHSRRLSLLYVFLMYLYSLRMLFLVSTEIVDRKCGSITQIGQDWATTTLNALESPCDPQRRTQPIGN